MARLKLLARRNGMTSWAVVDARVTCFEISVGRCCRNQSDHACSMHEMAFSGLVNIVNTSRP